MTERAQSVPLESRKAHTGHSRYGHSFLGGESGPVFSWCKGYCSSNCFWAPWDTLWWWQGPFPEVHEKSERVWRTHLLWTNQEKGWLFPTGTCRLFKAKCWRQTANCSLSCSYHARAESVTWKSSSDMKTSHILLLSVIIGSSTPVKIPTLLPFLRA